MNIVPSIELIPAKYGVGTLLTQVPMDNSGDFSVSGATTPTGNLATRVNSQGFIETVLDNVPRLDYYTSSGTPGCPALLVEPAATNGILNSEDTATNWILGANLSSGYVDVIGVSGNNLTVAVSGSNIGTGAGALRRPSNNVALASGSTYTISFLVKKTGAHTIAGYYCPITGGAAGDLGGCFNVSGSFSSGSIYNTAGTTNRIRRVEQWGTNVYRCSETFTMTASGTLTQVWLGPTTAVNNPSHPAVGLGIAFAAPQVELGAIPTSFIPTTTTGITRGADVITKTGVSGLIGQPEGAIYAEINTRIYTGISSRRIISLRVDGNNLISLEIIGSNSLSLIITNGGSPVSLTYTIPSDGIYKVAAGYNNSTNGTSLYVNGNLIGTTTAVVPNLSSAIFGYGTRADGAAGTQFGDRIRAAAIYKTRLPNYLLESATSQIQSYSALASSLSYTVV